MSWILGIFIVLLYILHVYFFLYLKKLNVLDSWHIYCFIVHFAYLFLSLLKKTNCPGFLAYLLFYCIFCMSTSFFIFKKKKWMSWILGIFIVLLYKWLFFFFFHFLFVEILSDDALTLELDMSTPTPIEVDGWRLLFALWSGGIDDDIGFC